MRRSCGFVLLARVLLFASSASAQRIQGNQTEGFGSGRELVFTDTQQFYCTDEPFDALNHNGKVAAIDPYEFQRPRCEIGIQPTIDPAGTPVSTTDKLWVLVPFFETDPAEPAFTAELGETLKKVLGFVPDGFKKHPGVPVQCPEPGGQETAHKGMPGTCTMHSTEIDLGPVLGQLGLVPPNTTGTTPLVNHSHILDMDQQAAEWWRLEVMLVSDRNAWPDEEGTKGINSIAALRAAQKAGQARADIPTNFFLFFASDFEK